MIQGKKILVTGGTGFIGSALVAGLIRAGARVRSFDDDSRGRRRRLAGVEGVEFAAGDIRDAAAVADAVRGVDAVCHLAYVNGTEFFYTKPDLVLDVAVKGMINVLDACKAHGVRELVLASSSEVYQTPLRVPTDERAPLVVPDPLNPRYSYGGGKIICELLALHAGPFLERTLIFRPHNVYGPDMGFEHVIPQLALKLAPLLKQGGTVRLPIQGQGTETRAFVYVSDLVDGVLAMMERGAHRGIYHVGTEDEVTVAQLARQIGRAVGREVEVVPGPAQPGGTPRRCPDTSKIRALGYAPRMTLQAGLEKTVPWYLDHADERR
jgi:nucleoside-diphosphate-sugar epimerase